MEDRQKRSRAFAYCCFMILSCLSLQSTCLCLSILPTLSTLVYSILLYSIIPVTLLSILLYSTLYSSMLIPWLQGLPNIALWGLFSIGQFQRRSVSPWQAWHCWHIFCLNIQAVRQQQSGSQAVRQHSICIERGCADIREYPYRVSTPYRETRQTRQTRQTLDRQQGRQTETETETDWLVYQIMYSKRRTKNSVHTDTDPDHG